MTGTAYYFVGTSGEVVDDNYIRNKINEEFKRLKLPSYHYQGASRPSEEIKSMLLEDLDNYRNISFKTLWWAKRVEHSVVLEFTYYYDSEYRGQTSFEAAM
ncbi:hypothetical protein H4219_004732 [Mycoemilia scoparia]|uniref:Uncharacterized protein n=1 Tax=Mycoemilia scoparia TaxID=417184 RepID=A0A9W7ZYT4_9FUNG|nr:hypothetical protein H4219_004732 [Mycoemilia scoparia]